MPTSNTHARAFGVKNPGQWPRHRLARCRTAFRHFFASWCINPKERGGRELPPKVVQDLLGHSTISMTLDIYGHWFPSKGDRESVYWAEARHKCDMAALSLIKTIRGQGLQIRARRFDSGRGPILRGWQVAFVSLKAGALQSRQALL
jgi:hypothetical protein